MMLLAVTSTTPAWWVAPGVIAAVIAAAVALLTLASQIRRARTDRHRQLLADAFAAVTEYCEFPYVIRRRASGDADRTRISTAMSDVQSRLAHSQALISIEAPTVATHFEHLVAEIRRIAGDACRESWNRNPLEARQSANIADIDLSDLEPAKAAYLQAVRKHLNPFRARISAAWRWRPQRRRAAAAEPVPAPPLS